MNTWLRDAELGDALAMLSWVREGVSGGEPDPFTALQRVFLLSDRDLDLAKRVAGLGWFTDGVVRLELEALANLEGIAALDANLARNAADPEWFADDVFETEIVALASLRSIADLDVGLARSAAAQPWFTNRMTADERDALWTLENLARLDVALAVRTADASGSWSPRLVLSSLRALASSRSQPQEFDVLAAQPWFADGLSRQDAAFLPALTGTIGWPELYDELTEAHFAESTTIDGRAGKLYLWLFSNRPIDPLDTRLDHFVQAILTSEEFTGEPFPTQDVIMLLADGHSLGGAYYFDSHVVVGRRGEDQVHPHTVFHEAAHYYMDLGNPWLVEGGANFIARIGLAKVGLTDLDTWPAYVERSVREGCALDPGVGTIQDLTDYQEDADSSQNCHYVVGEHFLYRLRAAMGHDAIGAALGEIYAAGRRDVGRPLSEEEAYEIVLKHTPADRRESVEAVYRELHGGPFAAGFEDIEPEPSVPAALSRELPPWSGSPPDKVHAAALAAIVDVWEVDSGLGLSLAQAAWVVDGVDHGEAIALNALHEIAAIDARLAGEIAAYAWVSDGFAFWERKAIEAVARLAAHSRGDAERVARYSWVTDGVTNEERLLLEFMAGAAAAAGDAGASFPRIAWMEDGLTDEEDYLLTSLRGLMALDDAFCLDVLGLPWIVGGVSSDHGVEEAAARGLAWLVEADGRLANDVIRLGWVADDMMAFDESSALEHIGIIARRNVQDAERIINSPWFRDGIDIDDVLRLQDYFPD